MLGGPAGTHVGQEGWWTPVRVLLAITTLALLPGAVLAPGPVWRVALCGAVALATCLVLVLADRATRSGRWLPGWAAGGWAAAPVLVLHWQGWAVVAAAQVAVLLWALGRRGLLGAVVGTVAALGAGWVAVDHLWSAQPDLGSVWLLVAQVGDGATPESLRHVLSGAIVAVAVVVSGHRHRRGAPSGTPPDAAHQAGGLLLVVAAVLLVAPTVPPEASLLLAPVAALGVRRWAWLLAWQGCELASWLITRWHLDGLLAPTAGGVEVGYWPAILLRLAGVLCLVVAVLRGSADDDAVDVGRGEADPDLDLLADRRHPRT